MVKVKIKYQIILSQGLLVFLSVLIIFLNIVTLSSMENDANFINHAGKLRALNYKMAYLSSLIEMKEEGFDLERQDLLESIYVYENILEGLIHGSTELGTRKLYYSQTLERLETIENLWFEKYKNTFLAIYLSEGNILRLEDIIAYVNSIDEMVNAHARYSMDKVVKAIYMNGALILVIVLTSSYSFFSANSKIQKPVYDLLKELEDMGLIDEDLAKRINLSKKNELTIMSSYIDELIYDGLTKVYNRRAGLPKLSRMISDDSDGYKVYSLCYIDINGLKQVNDELGHKYGDDLILTVVELVKKNIREDDFVIRLGGDEFLIVFKDVEVDIAKNIWKRISESYEKINDALEKPYIISVSHGIVSCNNRDKCDVDTLIRMADEKMYEEKRNIKDLGFSVVRKAEIDF